MGAIRQVGETVYAQSNKRGPNSFRTGRDRFRAPKLLYRGAKRGLDLVSSWLIFALCSPILVAAFLAVKLTSPGPGLFWSERVGRGGRVFAMPKLRTMRQDAQLAPRESLGDDCVTPVGRFLRQTSIDELPQLWCVIRGEMSLVGPRPLLPDDEAVRQRKKLGYGDSVRPGITGLAQVKGRNLVTPRRKARYDLFYAHKASIFLDARILGDTVLKVVARDGVL